MDTTVNSTRKLVPDATSPNAWTGEVDCLVGPFSSKDVAEYFAAQIVNSDASEARAGEIEVVGDAWFLRVEAGAET